jgi:hypothetical protein
VGRRQLKDGAVTRAKIADRAVTGAKVNVSNFPAVPNARHANHADLASNSAELDGRPSSAYVLARTLHPTSAFLENGWSTGSSFGVAGYAKDQFGIVHLFGAADQNSGSPSAADLFTLPVGLRPAYTIDAVAHFGSTNTPPGLLRISPDGSVSPDSGTTSVELEGITFAAGG